MTFYQLDRLFNGSELPAILKLSKAMVLADGNEMAVYPE